MHSPLSNSGHCTFLKSVEPARLSQRWQSELGVCWEPPSEVAKLEYWRDESTGLHFYTPPAAAGGAGLYLQLQRLPWYYMHEKWEFEAALQLLASFPNVSRILEIGVGQGAFLLKARHAGFNISGMELNPAGARAARDQGFTVLEKDMAALYVDDPTPWDAICAFQVLEHLPDPRLFLNQAITLLKPGGFLVLSVPNAEIARKLDPERKDLLDQPPHHMSHWDQAVFRNLETFFPLKVMHVAFEPLASYHVSWFVGSWTQRLHKRVGRLGGKLLFNRLTIPVIEKVLASGLRHLVRGHTLLVCLQKIDAVPSVHQNGRKS